MNSHPHPICFVVWVKPTLLGVDTHGGRFKLLTSQFKILYFHYTRHLENSSTTDLQKLSSMELKKGENNPNGLHRLQKTQ